MNSEQKEKKYQQQEKIFERDSKRLKIYQVFAALALLSFILYNIKLCGRVEGQSREVKLILNEIASTSWEYPNGGSVYNEDGQRVGSDTTQVIFVLVKEDYFEELHEDTFHLIPYPTVEAIYGYHVQNWKPYSVVFYDFQWNIIEDEPLYIRKRKLFKK